MNARPWDRRDVHAYWPEPVDTIQYDPEQRKATDTATGEYIVMRPAVRESPGQLVFGTSSEDSKLFGGYTSNWYPDERIEAYFIRVLRSITDASKDLSPSEIDAAPIARMIRAQADAARAADPMFTKLQGHLAPPRVVVIDSRPETLADTE